MIGCELKDDDYKEPNKDVCAKCEHRHFQYYSEACYWQCLIAKKEGYLHEYICQTFADGACDMFNFTVPQECPYKLEHIVSQE